MRRLCFAFLLAASLVMIQAQNILPPLIVRLEAETGSLGGSAKIAFDHMDFSGKGFVAGFEKLGASLRFSINAPASGPAKLSIRYSSGWGFQSVGVYVDGQKAADLRLAGTTGWDEWAIASVSIQAAAGTRMVEIRRDRSDTGTINIDWLEFTLPQAPSTSPPIPEGSGRGLAKEVYEAESGILGGSAKIAFDHMDFSGKGFVAGFESVGASVRFPLPILTAGPITISLRYSAGFGDETVGIYVDGAKAADLPCPRTPSWDSWSTVSATLPLSQGTHIVEIRRDRTDTGLINLDSITYR